MFEKESGETSVRAGVVPVRRSMLYVGAALVVLIGFIALGIALFGPLGAFTGLLVGAVAAILAGAALFRLDVVELTDHAIYLRTPGTTEILDWDRIRAGRFTLDEQSRWCLALDLTAGEDPHSELILLSIPAVTHPVSGPYEQHKREQVNEVRNLLRSKRIPITVLPEIAAALQQHWNISPPTAR